MFILTIMLEQNRSSTVLSIFALIFVFEAGRNAVRSEFADDIDVGASIIARVDAPPVLQPAEHILDLVALAVERAIVVGRIEAI